MACNQQNLQNPITIESVQAQLAAWRAAPVRTSSFPQDIWENILSLVTTHKRSQLCRAFKLNHAQLLKRIKAKQARSSASSSKSNPLTHHSGNTSFVELKSPLMTNPHITIELRNTQGTVLTVHLQNEQMLFSVLSKLSPIVQNANNRPLYLVAKDLIIYII